MILAPASPPLPGKLLEGRPWQPIQARFEAQVARAPQAVALVHRGETLSYAALNQRANHLAQALVALGVGADTVVGVAMGRSFELIVALLAVLKAGGAYLPLDPAAPAERVRFMLADAAATIVLRSADFPVALPDGVRVLDMPAPPTGSAPNPDLRSGPEHLAYVNYTSGSSGRPKGVATVHRGVDRLLFAAQPSPAAGAPRGPDYVRLDATRVLLQLAPAAFDAATFEIWGALLHGGRCVLFEGFPSVARLASALADHRVTTLFLTTALFNAIVEVSPSLLAPVEELLTGGEAHSMSHVRRAVAALPGTRISNVYGPTECTTFATHHPIRPADLERTSLPIGRPIGGTDAFVLDAELRPTPVGEVGELFLGGPGLARGYLHRPELTQERFLEVPAAGGQRLYRTGDLVRWLPDASIPAASGGAQEGVIDFVGRADQQVKVHGFRVELGEVEARLREHPGVLQAAVVMEVSAVGGAAGSPAATDKRLAAFLVAEGEPVRTQEIRAFLADRLPAYMLPSRVTWLESLPLTPNGKVDRRALAGEPT